MTILLISALISAVIASIWYSNKKQKIYGEYQKKVQLYIDQMDEPQQKEKVEEHYTMFFKVTDKQYKRFFDDGE